MIDINTKTLSVQGDGTIISFEIKGNRYNIDYSKPVYIHHHAPTVGLSSDGYIILLQTTPCIMKFNIIQLKIYNQIIAEFQMLANSYPIHFFNKTKSYGNFGQLQHDAQNKLFRNTSFETPIMFSVDNVTGYDVFQNGQSVIQGSAGRALIGGLAFGEVGAVIGAAGKKKIKTNSTVEFIFNLDFIDYPCHRILLRGEKDKKIKYETAMHNAQELAAILDQTLKNRSVHVHVDNPSDSSASQEPVQSQPASTADEILKYKSLLDMGAITQEEFELKKRQLLGL